MRPYERPELFVIGSIETMTWSGDGNDPCRDVGPHAKKQTGEADVVHSQANLISCSV